MGRETKGRRRGIYIVFLRVYSFVLEKPPFSIATVPQLFGLDVHISLDVFAKRRVAEERMENENRRSELHFRREDEGCKVYRRIIPPDIKAAAYQNTPSRYN